MSLSKTIIGAEGRLPNVHPGDILRDDFLVGTEIPMNEVALASGIPLGMLTEVVASRRHVDAAVDARLTRYFGMSPGFFLRLQNSFDLEEVLLREGEALDRIVPRAA